MSNNQNTQHLSQGFIAERRLDSIIMLLPVVVSVTTLTGLLVAAFTFRDDLAGYWSLWLCMVASPLSALIARHYLRKDMQVRAANVFLFAHLMLLSLILIQFWDERAYLYLPYAFSIFIVVSSMMINVRASFVTWFGSVLLPMAGLVAVGQFTLNNLALLLPAAVINLVLAGMGFLAAYDWELALESVSLLQRKAQNRRDELFEVEQVLSATNARLQHLNSELEKARTVAVDERDTRTRFMNNLSHELRTPLNAIVNFANILARGGTGPLNDRQVDYLERVERSGWHLLEVLNDLLDMAQIEAGEFKLHLEQADLEQICEEAMMNARGLILDKPIQLARAYPDEWPVVNADVMRLKQSLFNVLGNAAKYTEKGVITLQVEVEQSQVKLIVADTGIGIDPAHHERIFDEFQQLDQTIARKRSGTGLGLPITRHLLLQHGGTIEVESELGVGSRFIMTLPIATRDERVVQPV